MPHVDPVRACPACDASCPGWAFCVDGYPHLRCTACGSLFVHPLPCAQTLAATYQAPGYHASAAAAAARMHREAAERVATLARRGVRTILEVGSGPGHFLDAARAAGLEIEGLEPGLHGAATQARGHRVHRTWMAAFEPAQSYDAVAMWEVLEHLPDPRAALRQIHTWLAPQGWLALSTPQGDGLAARLLGRRFPMVTPPDHLTLFSQRGLRRLLTSSGFQVETWTTFSGLGREELERGLARYALGPSRLAQVWARRLAPWGVAPMRWVDRCGWGTSILLLARRA